MANKEPRHYKLVVLHWHDKHDHFVTDEVFLLREGQTIKDRLIMRYGREKAEYILENKKHMHTHSADRITKFFVDRLSFYDRILFDHLDIDYDRFYKNEEYDLVEKYDGYCEDLEGNGGCCCAKNTN